MNQEDREMSVEWNIALRLVGEITEPDPMFSFTTKHISPENRPRKQQKVIDYNRTFT